MSNAMSRWGLMLAVVALLALSGCATNVYPVYLTWQGDTSTTMTVNYQTRHRAPNSSVYFDTESRDGDVNAYRFHTRGDVWTLPGLPDERYINSVELSNLEPGALYYFVAGDVLNGFSEEKRFRTIPRDGAPLRFIVGGDMSVLPREKLLLKQAKKFNPQFALIGGDIAYANGDLDNYFLWDIWLKRWSTIMVTGEKTLVPLVLAIGNHEVNDDGGAPEGRSPFYLGYLPQGGSSYFTRTFGRDLAVLVLDTGHLVPHEQQKVWLEEQLQSLAAYPVSMALYHVPFYPSVRDFDGDLSIAGRTHWLPLFDQYQLDTAFENHDHAFKRSKLLRGGAVDPEGTLYLGDGCFGVQAREVASPAPWYIEKSSDTAHFWVVDLSTEATRYRAVDSWGNEFDEVIQPR